MTEKEWEGSAEDRRIDKAAIAKANKKISSGKKAKSGRSMGSKR